MVWFTVKAVDKDDVDESPADGGIDLCEAVTTDLWSSRGCLEKVSTCGEGRILGKRESGNLPSWPCKRVM